MKMSKKLLAIYCFLLLSIFTNYLLQEISPVKAETQLVKESIIQTSSTQNLPKKINY
jgi:hypothetical protein